MDSWSHLFAQVKWSLLQLPVALLIFQVNLLWMVSATGTKQQWNGPSFCPRNNCCPSTSTSCELWAVTRWCQPPSGLQLRTFNLWNECQLNWGANKRFGGWNIYSLFVLSYDKLGVNITKPLQLLHCWGWHSRLWGLKDHLDTRICQSTDTHNLSWCPLQIGISLQFDCKTPPSMAATRMKVICQIDFVEVTTPCVHNEGSWIIACPCPFASQFVTRVACQWNCGPTTSIGQSATNYLCQSTKIVSSATLTQQFSVQH